MTRKSLFPAYIQIKMTERDKEILEAAALKKSTTASELVRAFIRSLEEEIK